jgi:AcrR family transcriptional regulator
VFGIAADARRIGIQSKAALLNTEISTHQRILNAAIRIALKSGVKSLTQPKVAKAAGVTQSHLTYYFPRKADLLAAVLEASHCYGHAAPPQSRAQAMQLLEELMFDANRMRFFLGAVIEAGDDANLRKALAAHVEGLAKEIAPHFGRTADDPVVGALLDQLRGLGIRLLLEPKKRVEQKIDVPAIANELGLLTQDPPGSDSSPAIESIPETTCKRPQQGPSIGRTQPPSAPVGRRRSRRKREDN